MSNDNSYTGGLVDSLSNIMDQVRRLDAPMDDISNLSLEDKVSYLTDRLAYICAKVERDRQRIIDLEVKWAKMVTGKTNE